MSFEFKKISHDLLFDAEATMYPTVMHGRGPGDGAFVNIASTHFGFVTEGVVTIRRENLPPMELSKGMYFAVPGKFKHSGSGTVLVIERLGYRSMFSVGGPIEESGRLCYIDNCSVSQLVPPARRGDPTFQQLVFPPNVDQSMHLHPTIRMGYVHSGSGICKMSDGSKHPLEVGQVFYLHERQVHGFQSLEQKLVVIAFHPDSDVGPTDQCHPMLSRTYKI